MDPVMTCPRCDVAMQLRIGPPRPGAKAIRVDVCGNCSSMWLDDYELGEVAPPLAKLPMHASEHALGAKKSERFGACPRCAVSHSLVEVGVLDVTVDLCTNCKGVFLDGGELEAIQRAVREEEQSRGTGGYRVAPEAARAVKPGYFACLRCNEEKATGESCIIPAGLVCGTCYYATDEVELKSERASAEVRGALLATRVGDYESSLLPEVRISWGAVLRSFFAASPRFCPHCGSPEGDGCIHERGAGDA